jgi:O-antigen/teichoic acid export membrane protein
MIFVYAFILNLATFFQLTTQAIRQFNFLTMLNVSRGIAFLALIVLLFAVGYLEYQYVIIVLLASYLLFLIIMAVRYHRYLWGNVYAAPSVLEVGKININAGLFILLGNFVFVIFCTLDRLLVSAFFTIEQFAVYAFAMAVVNIALTFIKATSDVLFPYLSAAAPTQRSITYQLVKLVIILCWAAFLCAYFPLAVLIEAYLPLYTTSLPIIKIMLCTVGFSSLILILQINYYWLYLKQRQYFIMGIIGLTIAIMLVLISIKMRGSLESVAIAILISFLVWHIINLLSLKKVTGESGRKMSRDIIIMGCYFAGFWLSDFIGDGFIIHMIIYGSVYCILTWLLLRNEIRELVMIANRLRKRHE